MKKNSRASPEATSADRLLQATIQQIEEHGLGQLTIRGVAAAADVNIAAVNYYFRSKEALVAAALESSIRHMLSDSAEFIARLPDDPVRVLGELLGYYLEGSLRYPKISKALLHDAFMSDDYSGAFPTLFQPTLRQLCAVFRAALPSLDEKSAQRRVIAALSAVFFPAFFAGLYHPLGALDSPSDRSSYVQTLARQALAPETATA